MKNIQAIEGLEFDWFANDAPGYFALSSAPGAGSVPQSVFASREIHESIGETIDFVDWGTPEVWKSFSQAGLYVYD